MEFKNGGRGAVADKMARKFHRVPAQKFKTGSSILYAFSQPTEVRNSQSGRAMRMKSRADEVQTLTAGCVVEVLAATGL
jgi:hypothetical protein